MGHSPCIGTGAMRLRVPFMIARQYEPATMKMVLWQKDMQVIADRARAVNCPRPLLDACRPRCTVALAMGLAEADTAATAEVLPRMAGGVDRGRSDPSPLRRTRGRGFTRAPRANHGRTMLKALSANPCRPGSA
ncbi:MAG: 2-hydroxy-3-oxopropionate reductase [Pseudomonadota bacterium]|jgi:hypothetical protein